MMTYETQLLSGENAACEAARLLAEGECVAIPTETVYGLAAKADLPSAVAKIFEAKKRPGDHPLILHISAASEVAKWARDIPEDFHKLAAAFWPGPLTLVLKKSSQVSSEVTGGLDSLAIRMPAHPLFLEILTRLNGAVVAPSANMHKELSPVSAEQVLTSMKGRIPAVVDGGRSVVGLESTIVDLTSDEPCILRAGPISESQLEAVLGKKIQVPLQHSVKISGNMKAHYQPKARLQLLHRSEIIKRLALGNKYHDFYLIQSEDIFDDMKRNLYGSVQAYKMPLHYRDYAYELYYTLAKADREGAQFIFVEAVPETSEWLAVNDRLKRAQG